MSGHYIVRALTKLSFVRHKKDKMVLELMLENSLLTGIIVSSQIPDLCPILSQPSQIPIFTPEVRESTMVESLAKGHEGHDRDSNPHSDDATIRILYISGNETKDAP